jgi:hypothetical protein
MKPVKNLVFAALLVFTIAFNTFGGDIDQPGNPAPPPPRATATTDETVPVTSTDDTQQTTVETSDYIIFEALAALLSVY